MRLLVPGVDNWAHAGGFIGGYFCAKWLDPLKPERGDHVLIGAVLFLACIVAVFVSLWHGYALIEGDPRLATALGCER